MLHGIIGQIALFIGSLALSIAASAVMAHRVDQVGASLGLSEGMLGMATALGADAPEISVAITAIASGQHDLGMSVIFGSNIFNLAALLGLSAAVAGPIRVRRRGLALDAGVAFWVTAVVAAQAAGYLSTAAAGALLAAGVVPYLTLFVLGAERIGHLGLPPGLTGWFAGAVGGTGKNARKDQTPRKPGLIDKLALFPLLAAVVLSSIGLVRSATALGAHWGVPEVFVGALALAALTGIPNLIAALRLARRGRGSAVANESFTSNTINLLVGGFMPLALLELGPLAPEGQLAMAWLIGMTAAAGLLCYAQRGLSRWGGGTLLALYAGFVLITLMWR